MEGDIGLIVEATRKASRYLQRDYFELESLQSSSQGTSNFCNKSCNKVLQTLHENLSKYYKTVIFDNKEAEKSDFSGKAVFVETLDGLDNLGRALPFFAIMVTMVYKKDGEVIAERSVMNFPALGEIYYTEKGRGVWLERHSSNLAGVLRSRVSGSSDLSKALVATNCEHIDVAQKFSPNLRVYESYSYALALLVSGKADVMIANERALSELGVKLFVSEAAGSYITDKGLIIASNFKLAEEIKSRSA
ncbi:MAG: inositol monophosphatase family protein [Rickettsiaceae bacterium]|nr:inositol monophosphatase family protein [Rickettsiaceae bacterium]